jgi:DNA-directed RNA polymerase subunit N
MVPVRCFTCGKVIGQSWEEFNKRVGEGEDAGKVMDGLGLTRYCCRQVFMGTVDLIKEIDQFKP